MVNPWQIGECGNPIRRLRHQQLTYQNAFHLQSIADFPMFFFGLLSVVKGGCINLMQAVEVLGCRGVKFTFGVYDFHADSRSVVARSR